MFVEANVMSLLKDAEIRHFLDPHSAVYTFATSKRLRLMKRRHEQMATACGMLIGSSKLVDALRGLGLLEVTINTDKSDVIPDVEELVEEKKRQRRTWVESDEEKRSECVSDMAGVEELSLESLDDPVSGPTAEADGSDRRRSFGADKRGWMEVDLSDKADEAVVRVVSFGGDESLSQEDIVRTLQEEYGIREGLDLSAISSLAANATASPDRAIRGNFVVARGLGRQVPSIGHIEFTFLAGIEDDDPFDYEALRSAMASRSITQVTERTIAACLVMPGQELAVFHPAGAEGGRQGPETPPQARGLLQAGSLRQAER